MAPTKRERSIKEVGPSSQAPSQPQWTSQTSIHARAQCNIPQPTSIMLLNMLV